MLGADFGAPDATFCTCRFLAVRFRSGLLLAIFGAFRCHFLGCWMSGFWGFSSQLLGLGRVQCLGILNCQILGLQLPGFGFEMQDLGSWVQGFGVLSARVLSFGCKTLGFGGKVLGFRCKALVFGCKALGT